MQSLAPFSSRYTARLTRLWSIHTLDQLNWIPPFFAAKLRGSCIALEGECGAGKTEFARALLHALDAQAGQPPRRVLSPSFAVHHAYAPRTPEDAPIEHFDFYRLRGEPDELAPLDYSDIRERCLERKGFVLIEWASRFPEPVLGLTHRLRIEVPIDGPPESRYFQLDTLVPMSLA